MGWNLQSTSYGGCCWQRGANVGEEGIRWDLFVSHASRAFLEDGGRDRVWNTILSIPLWVHPGL